ncbi:LPXTG cell wall anchor domain-containing protein [Streptococcus pluranimalium]
MQKKYIYSIRKFKAVGLASAVIGLSFMGTITASASSGNDQIGSDRIATSTVFLNDEQSTVDYNNGHRPLTKEDGIAIQEGLLRPEGDYIKERESRAKNQELSIPAADMGIDLRTPINRFVRQAEARPQPQGNIIYVKNSGDGDGSSSSSSLSDLSLAVNKAKDGDTIRLSGDLTQRTPLIISKSVTIDSENPSYSLTINEDLTFEKSAVLGNNLLLSAVGESNKSLKLIFQDNVTIHENINTEISSRQQDQRPTLVLEPKPNKTVQASIRGGIFDKLSTIGEGTSQVEVSNKGQFRNGVETHKGITNLTSKQNKLTRFVANGGTLNVTFDTAQPALVNLYNINDLSLKNGSSVSVASPDDDYYDVAPIKGTVTLDSGTVFDARDNSFNFQTLKGSGTYKFDKSETLTVQSLDSGPIIEVSSLNLAYDKKTYVTVTSNGEAAKVSLVTRGVDLVKTETEYKYTTDNPKLPERNENQQENDEPEMTAPADSELEENNPKTPEKTVQEPINQEMPQNQSSESVVTQTDQANGTLTEQGQSSDNEKSQPTSAENSQQLGNEVAPPTLILVPENPSLNSSESSEELIQKNSKPKQDILKIDAYAIPDTAPIETEKPVGIHPEITAIPDTAPIETEKTVGIHPEITAIPDTAPIETEKPVGIHPEITAIPDTAPIETEKPVGIHPEITAIPDTAPIETEKPVGIHPEITAIPDTAPIETEKPVGIHPEITAIPDTAPIETEKTVSVHPEITAIPDTAPIETEKTVGIHPEITAIPDTAPIETEKPVGIHPEITAIPDTAPIETEKTVSVHPEITAIPDTAPIETEKPVGIHPEITAIPDTAPIETEKPVGIHPEITAIPDTVPIETEKTVSVHPEITAIPDTEDAQSKVPNGLGVTTSNPLQSVINYAPVDILSMKQKTKEATLPSTGETNSSLLAAYGVIGLISGLGLVARKKRGDDA